MTNETTVEEEKEYLEDQEKRKNRTRDGEKDGDKKKRTAFRPFSKDLKSATTDSSTDEKKKEKPAAGESEEETDAVKGYGKPTKGSYNSTEKGYKTFGTEGQGNNTEGVKEKNSTKGACRQTTISVTAVADQGSDTVFLEVGTYEFLDDYDYTWDEENQNQNQAARIMMAAVATMVSVIAMM